MNFSAQIKRGITALVLCSAIASFALTHAATAENTAATQSAVAVVASTRIDVAARPLACDSNARFTTRVHVGRPLRVSANPTARQIARAAR
jgi:hypothetical protein